MESPKNESGQNSSLKKNVFVVADVVEINCYTKNHCYPHILEPQMSGRCNCSSREHKNPCRNLYRNSTTEFAERDQKGFYYTQVSVTTTTSTITFKYAVKNITHKYLIPEKTDRMGFSAESRTKN